jgi:5-methylcytosine-specific restriction protein A
MPNDPYYHSEEWRGLRQAVRQRSGGICEVPGCTKPAKVVDHIVRRVPGQRVALSDLRDLCRGHDNQVKEGASGKRRNGGKFTIKGCDANGVPNDPARR